MSQLATLRFDEHGSYLGRFISARMRHLKIELLETEVQLWEIDDEYI